MGYTNILLIDDDTDDHEIFESALNDISKVPVFTGIPNAHDALQKLDRKELNPDIIFLDLNMPVMSGQEFLMEIKKRDQMKHIPVIIFSTTSNASTIRLMKEMGAVDFVTKPDEFDQIVAMLKRILHL